MMPGRFVAEDEVWRSLFHLSSRQVHSQQFMACDLYKWKAAGGVQPP